MGTETMSARTPNQPLLNETDAADYLGLQISTLRRWRWAGTGPAFLKLGSAVRYDPNDLQAYLDECRQRSTTAPISMAQAEKAGAVEA